MCLDLSIFLPFIFVFLNSLSSVSFAYHVCDRTISWSRFGVDCLDEVYYFSTLKFEHCLFTFLRRDYFVVNIETVFESCYFAWVTCGDFFLLLSFMKGLKKGFEIGLIDNRIFFKFWKQRKRRITLLFIIFWGEGESAFFFWSWRSATFVYLWLFIVRLNSKGVLIIRVDFRMIFSWLSNWALFWLYF